MLKNETVKTLEENLNAVEELNGIAQYKLNKIYEIIAATVNLALNEADENRELLTKASESRTELTWRILSSRSVK